MGKMADKGGQDLRKVGPPSNTGTHVGDDGPQAEVRGDKTSGRRAQHT